MNWLICLLSANFRGNSLLVGAVGSHLTTLCQLALHVADVQVLRIDTSKQSNFFDGLRSAVRLTGSEGKILTLMFTVSVLDNIGLGCFQLSFDTLLKQAFEEINLIFLVMRNLYAFSASKGFDQHVHPLSLIMFC